MTIEAMGVSEALRKHFSIHGARLHDKVIYKGHDVFLADGGPHFDAKNHKVVALEPGPGELLEEDKWMKEGYYVSVWGLQRGRAVIGFPLYFKLNHDLNLGVDFRSKARMNSALESAKSAIDAMINVGLLHHFEGRILIPN